ncbi:MAG TPA: penicillin-binding transpeptidase domain-containing protein [Actinomycetota bacterium]|jgi:peptidoglycan glycosyltransferase|nr:penicillin-binding transpeptidase domain-containing protein [Actinomycetota bacterium]
MDRRIRQIAGLLTLLLLAVAGSAGWVQGLRAENVAQNEPCDPDDQTDCARNRFRIFAECRWERGPILSIDGQVLAESARAPEGRRCLYERTYPAEGLVSHVVGQWSLHYGKTGLEKTYNAELIGEPLPAKSIGDLFRQRPRVGNTLVSTIDTRLQNEALSGLEGRRGGVVALNPKTGAVLVAASNPSYDPNPLASNDRAEADRARCDLGVGVKRLSDGTPLRDESGNFVECENAAAPLLSVALQARRPPGSSFKVVTAAAALESGKYSPDQPTVPFSGAYTAPGDTRPIRNFGGGSCGGSLANALRVSCNTAFAQIGVDIGPDRLLSTAHAMGFDQFGGPAFVGCDGESVADIDLTRTGCLPSKIIRYGADGAPVGEERLETPAFRARAGFGQWVLQASPFGMAQVAATVANGGFVPRPRFAERVIDRAGTTVKEIRTGVGPTAISPEAAGQLAQMMRRVVTAGTAAGALGGFSPPVAGKTGTAQQPSCAGDEAAIFGEGCGRLPHAWFLAFAPLDDPTIAIAVLVERGGGTNEAATGGRVAAPIARRVLDAYFKLYPTAAGVNGDDE